MFQGKLSGFYMADHRTAILFELVLSVERGQGPTHMRHLHVLDARFSKSGRPTKVELTITGSFAMSRVPTT